MLCIFYEHRQIEVRKMRRIYIASQIMVVFWGWEGDMRMGPEVSNHKKFKFNTNINEKEKKITKMSITK